VYSSPDQPLVAELSGSFGLGNNFR